MVNHLIIGKHVDMSSKKLFKLVGVDCIAILINKEQSSIFCIIIGVWRSQKEIINENIIIILGNNWGKYSLANKKSLTYNNIIVASEIIVCQLRGIVIAISLSNKYLTIDMVIYILQ